MNTTTALPRFIDNFVTMERGATSALILKSVPGAKPPVSASWLPSGLELTFEQPAARSVVLVPTKFRSKWVDRVLVGLFTGAGDIEGDQVAVDAFVPVQIVAAA